MEGQEDAPRVSKSEKDAGRGVTSGTTNTFKAVVTVIVAIVAIVAGRYYSVRDTPINDEVTESSEIAEHDAVKAAMPRSDWIIDPIYAEDFEKHVKCDFPVYTALNVGTSDEKVIDSEGRAVTYEDLISTPAIMRGFMESWPAMKNQSWSRASLISKYGRKVVVYDAAPSLVYSDRRHIMKFHSLSKSLQSIRTRRKTESAKGAADSFSDSVIHDTTILKSITKLGSEFKVPEIFRHWALSRAEAAAAPPGTTPDPAHGQNAAELLDSSWHILSIGASKTGLPFHSSGHSYMSLVHGMKRWFIYPPGMGPPADVLKETHPLRSMWGWFTSAYTLFSDDHSKAPIKNFQKNLDKKDNYRPIECLQKPGEIVFVPAGWSHSHLNIGETVAIGHEQVFHADERWQQFSQILQKKPDDVDSMLHVAISQAYMALQEENRVKYNVTASTSNGMVRLNPQNRSMDLQALVLDGEDTWLVQYFNQGSDHSRALALLWNRVAGALKGLASVGAIEIPDKKTDPEGHKYVITEHDLDGHLDENGLLSNQVVRIFPGEDRPSRGILTVKDVVNTSIKFNPEEHPREESGLGIGMVSQPQAMVDWAVNVMATSTMKAGSVTHVSAKAKRLYRESISLLQKCVEMQPFHPEIRTHLADVLGYAGHMEDMAAVIDDGVRLYNPLSSAALAKEFNTYTPSKIRPEDRHANFIPAAVLAPIYHNFAEILLSRDKGSLALPLLERALALQPNYGPALIDTVLAYISMKEREKAEKAMDLCVESGAMLKSHPRLSQIREYLDIIDENNAKRKEGLDVEDPKSVSTVSRRGQPQPPPQTMRKSKVDDISQPEGKADKRTGRSIPIDQKRGMSKSEAFSAAVEKFDGVSEEDYNVSGSQNAQKGSTASS